MNQGPPLPLPRSDARVVTVGVELVEGEQGGAVFVWGNAAWCWAPGDNAARRLAAVQMVVTTTAGQREVAAAFGVNENTVWRWRSAYDTDGVEALTAKRRGPQGPSKLTDATVARIVAARAEGLTMAAIAQRVGVSLNSVSRALKPAAATDAVEGDAADVAEGEGDAAEATDAAEDTVEAEADDGGAWADPAAGDGDQGGGDAAGLV
ncbi:MAG: helix-turn-helix domain-containing protein, partial [Egibacteraceae bacterium]